MNDPCGLIRGKTIGVHNFSLVGILAALKRDCFNLHCLSLTHGANLIIFECVQYFVNCAMRWQL